MDKKLISQAIKALDLIDIYLHSSSVQRFEEITDSDYPENMLQQNKLGVSAEFLDPESNDADFHRIINAKVTLGVRFITEDENKDINTLSEVEASFIAKYIQTCSVSDEAISEFMSYNVVHNVWPFWREHALRTSSEARLPRPIISLFKQPTSE